MRTSDSSVSSAAATKITPGVAPETLLDVYRKMVLTRALDERVWQLNRQGRAAIVASCQGHEGAQVASVAALRPGTDLFYTYYRDLGVMIAVGMTPAQIMLAFMAKAGEPMSGARQFPSQGAMPELGLVNLSNVVATHLPQGVGAALAMRMQGSDAVVAIYFGDGASSTGDCHEAMNFAAVHKLPVIFLCENNGYAISVPVSKQMAVDSIAARAAGYGMPGVTVDGTDAAAVYEVTAAAAERARAGDGPTLIEAMVERFKPHTGDDDHTRYRSAEELANLLTRDPVQILRSQLVALGALSEGDDDEIAETARREIDEATDTAEAAPFPDASTFFHHVYSD
jgi:2-oxoisovalerate dehydrogenase E1 component alpha subunit